MMMMMTLIIWIVTMTMMILKGRYDVVCPLTSAWELHKALPHSELKIMGDAGHSMGEVSIAKQLVEFTEKYK